MSYIEMMAITVDIVHKCKRCPAYHACDIGGGNGNPIDYDKAKKCQEEDK